VVVQPNENCIHRQQNGRIATRPRANTLKPSGADFGPQCAGGNVATQSLGGLFESEQRWQSISTHCNSVRPNSPAAPRVFLDFCEVFWTRMLHAAFNVYGVFSSQSMRNFLKCTSRNSVHAAGTNATVAELGGFYPVQ